jgi:hypothetical protein
MIKTNFFTVCNGTYKDFIPIFILSHLYHNDDCFVEVGVDSKLDPQILEGLEILDRFYPNKFNTYTVDFGPLKIGDKSYNSAPNTIRFLTEPKIISEYVYISDVDIICLQKDLSSIHIDNMKKLNLPYSNIVRPTKTIFKSFNGFTSHRRLSGLHFTKYDSYYPIPKYDDLCERGILNNDEVFLYEIVKKKYPIFNCKNDYRPVHGIHVSPNRNPTGGLNWGMSGWSSQWKEFKSSYEFVTLVPALTDIVKEKIKIIDDFYDNQDN